MFRGLILADLKIVSEHWDDENKAMRLQAAYHTQQAIEKTIKLKAEIKGLNLWGHDIGHLIKKCDDAGIDIAIPKIIRINANKYTKWEADCRYYPVKVVRKDSIKKAYDVVLDWINSGTTK